MIDRSKVYIGVDPGKSGALAVITYRVPNVREVSIFPFGEDTYVEVLSQYSDECRAILFTDCQVMVEQVHAMPHDGGKGAFSFGRNLGFIEGILQANKIPYQLVPPQVWKKEFSLTGKDKQASIDVCKKLFPEVSLKKTERCKKDDDGMAEALLIAEHCRRRCK